MNDRTVQAGRQRDLGDLLGDSGGLHLRVYYTNRDSAVEWCLDRGSDWYQGAYTTT